MQKNNDIPLSSMAIVPFLMASIAGFTDVLGFVGLNQLFTAHITGNIVVAIAEILNHSPSYLPKVLAIPLFILVVIKMTLLIERFGYTQKQLAIWFSIEAIFLLIFMFFALTVVQKDSINTLPYLLTSFLVIISMSIHNGLLRLFMPNFPPCTVMTGNLTFFVAETTRHLKYQKKSIPVEFFYPIRFNLKRLGTVITGFIVGGMICAVGFSSIGFHIVWIDVITVLVLAGLAFKTMPMSKLKS